MTSSPTDTSGLRGRKRERTRRAISDAAFRLFSEQGFDAVTLTRIAAAADVAPATVFTHFASKEDIFFSRREEFWTGMPETVGSARTWDGLLDGLRAFYAGRCERILSGDHAAHGRVFSRVLLESPALRRSYLAIAAERQQMLCELLAARAPQLPEAERKLFAALVVTVGETAYAAVHTALAAGEPAGRARSAAEDALDRGFARLARAYPGTAALTAAPA
ncbi:TetR/AcrR family transcriptional regulator [Streptomyces sp. SCA3-4]|uniref:TetR/AcrR family transcriptional regulator n=1 Tax=Streptomyces sichuanensis TaxID=2871810 RepID=UPI001CE32CCB|nr:TetR/AcrR family transcriptional regulator [Streptomyces sichuanensis]MCA6092449.1 TetR/AcrR family transcriptional regulator [Streptomyces sichuanensis]